MAVRSALTKHVTEGRVDIETQAQTALETGDFSKLIGPTGLAATQIQRNAQDAARAKLKPIADPDEGKAERRKSAARRRKKGRLGTLLSQRETLG